MKILFGIGDLIGALVICTAVYVGFATIVAFVIDLFKKGGEK